jgi:hypothetical protein
VRGLKGCTLVRDAAPEVHSMPHQPVRMGVPPSRAFVALLHGMHKPGSAAIGRIGSHRRVNRGRGTIAKPHVAFRLTRRGASALSCRLHAARWITSSRLMPSAFLEVAPRAARLVPGMVQTTYGWIEPARELVRHTAAFSAGGTHRAFALPRASRTIAMLCFGQGRTSTTPTTSHSHASYRPWPVRITACSQPS